ncbi:Undecaprenyl phosphate-alpha-4-amino-4-deoxy-L-arabinose arabinosyl transferase [Pseudomonas sp. 8 R 14]|nr:Undecaprenyl phosphate-alpha-4-amino-4-deoxy-L-arabinose arabinosyl transferase [Pseudomonas sp. 8 R 14]
MPGYLKTERGALLLLLGVSALLLTGLGARDLWGPETRWANIALQMLQSGDYFDPYLKGGPYYDKPLPSYWLITGAAHLGGLGPWSLRLPSVRPNGSKPTRHTPMPCGLISAQSGFSSDRSYTTFGLRLMNLAANLRGSLQIQRTGVEARTLQAYKRP